jgi:hypothetical protein
MTQAAHRANDPTDNPETTRRPQARAIGRDPRIGGQGIMASGTWKGRINRSKTWPHPNTQRTPISQPC